MSTERVLVVDDERNIRLTVGQALEALGVEVLEAVTAEEAQEVLRKGHISLLLLDLKLPGMDGMELLRRLRGHGNNVGVVIITAHGTVDNAVEAMKLGAVDFVQKPFTPDEIRLISRKALQRRAGFLRRMVPKHEPVPVTPAGNDPPAAPELPPETFDDCLERAKAAIEQRDFTGALPWTRKAISCDPARPEGYNILGVLIEIGGDTLQAQKYYRAAISIDPTYEPASHNLSRTTERLPDDVLDIGGRSEKRSHWKDIGQVFRSSTQDRRTGRSGGKG